MKKKLSFVDQHITDNERVIAECLVRVKAAQRNLIRLQKEV